jgi:hypothetical protein
MTHIDWSLDTGVVLSPTLDEATVLAAFRRRRYGDVDSWTNAAVFALIFAFGLVIALAGTTAHRLVLATAVPIVLASAAGWCRRRGIAWRLQSRLRVADRDALVEAARFLDRPEEADARVSALRLAATHTDDAFESALLALEAADAERNPRPPARTRRAHDIAVTSYCLIVGVVVAVAWAIELRS